MKSRGFWLLIRRVACQNIAILIEKCNDTTERKNVGFGKAEPLPNHKVLGIKIKNYGKCSTIRHKGHVYI